MVINSKERHSLRNGVLQSKLSMNRQQGATLGYRNVLALKLKYIWTLFSRQEGAIECTMTLEKDCLSLNPSSVPSPAV